MKYKILENPNYEETYELIEEGLRKKATILLFACCRVSYEGRALSELNWGERIIMIKPDGAFLIHQEKKVEPVKQWLAQLGSQRIDQMIDPELTFQMAVEDYRRQGYSDKWINERMRSIEMRKELTDEWKRSGITEQRDFAILTNVLTQAWSGMTTRQYKSYKGLTKENLRDNMTNVELALNTLAEVATTEYSRQSNPTTMEESKRIAREGGEVARDARKTIEKRLGRTVISSEKASDYLRPIENTESES